MEKKKSIAAKGYFALEGFDFEKIGLPFSDHFGAAREEYSQKATKKRYTACH